MTYIAAATPDWQRLGRHVCASGGDNLTLGRREAVCKRRVLVRISACGGQLTL